MTAEAKLRTLAQQSTELQAFLLQSPGLFRWFDTQLPPNYVQNGTCVTVLRVSTIALYTHETATQRSENRIQSIRFQIDVLDTESERARSAASAIRDWLATVDLSSNSQFGSPITSPTCHANQVLNQRGGFRPMPLPPVWVQTLDVKVMNLED